MGQLFSFFLTLQNANKTNPFSKKSNGTDVKNNKNPNTLLISIRRYVAFFTFFSANGTTPFQIGQIHFHDDRRQIL